MIGVGNGLVGGSGLFDNATTGRTKESRRGIRQILQIDTLKILKVNCELSGYHPRHLAKSGEINQVCFLGSFLRSQGLAGSWGAGALAAAGSSIKAGGSGMSSAALPAATSG